MAIIDGGYVMLARVITNSAVFEKSPICFKLWIWMLLQANHTRVKKNGVTYQRGELRATYQRMIEVTTYFRGRATEKPTKTVIKGCLNWLRKEQMITTKKTTRGLIIKIEKI